MTLSWFFIILLSIFCIILIFLVLREKVSVSKETKDVVEGMMRKTLEEGDIKAYRKFVHIYKSFE